MSIVAMLPCYSTAAEDLPERTLKGIRSVEVLVDSLKESSPTRIVLPGTIQTDVELRLRQFGLRVVSSDKMSADSGFPNLRVRLNVLDQTMGLEGTLVGYFFVVKVEVFQWVTLVRPPRSLARALTWTSRGVYGYVGTEKADSIQDAVRGEVDQFLNAYLAANPKSTGSR